MEIVLGEAITCLTIHHLASSSVERAKQFIKSHGGRWAGLPSASGAQYFIEFPAGTRILPNTGYRPHQHCWSYHIFLPDGAYLQAISLRIPGQDRRRNTIVLPSPEPARLITQPARLVAAYM